jgi:hypothetical protein
MKAQTQLKDEPQPSKLIPRKRFSVGWLLKPRWCFNFVHLVKPPSLEDEGRESKKAPPG